MQKKNKAIIGGLSVGAVAAAVALTGSTSAFYYDLETGRNTISACGFDLEYDAKEVGDQAKVDVQNGNVSITDVEPGDSFAVRLEVKNAGKCAGDLYAQVQNVADLDNGLLEPETQDGDTSGDEGELAEYVTLSAPLAGTLRGSLDHFATPRKLTALGGGRSGAMVIDVTVPDSGVKGNGNRIMTDSLSFDLALALVQTGKSVGANL